MAWQPLRRLSHADHPALDPAYRHGAGTNLRGPDEVWLSDLYEVWVWRGWRPATEGNPAVDYVSIKRRDKSAVHDWRHLQTIKNEVCGYEREGMELYPAESRLQDSVNQYHLFVFADGYSIPYGDFSDRNVSDDVPDVYVPNHPRQRPFEPGTKVSRARRKRAAKGGLIGT